MNHRLGKWCGLVLVLGLAWLAAPAAADEVKTLKWGHIFTPTSAMHKSSEMAASLVEKRTGGKLKIRLFPGEQLGSMLDEIEGVKLGTQDLTMVWGIDRFCPEFSLFNYPFIFRDEEHLWQVVNGPLGEKYIRKPMLERHGIRIIGAIYHGVRVLTTDAKHPVKGPEDVKGLRLRTPDITAWIKAWQSVGAKVTAFPWGELYLALQQGVVDAQENPMASVRSMKFHEVQKHVILTNHIIDYPLVMINDKKFQSLGPELQKALVEALDEARKWSIGQAKKEAEENIKFFREKGLTVTEVDMAQWQQAFSKAPDLFEGGREVYTQIQAVK